MTLIGQTAEFVPVKVKEALTQPEGFYSTLNSIDPSNRKLVIIRLPQDVSQTKTGLDFFSPFRFQQVR